MEDSEKRRERLKAMRSEAASASSNVNSSTVPGSLANPLLDTPAAPAAQDSTPRFDFYTDPMAAFSANRRSGPANQATQPYSQAPKFSSPTPGSWNPSMNSSPASQMQNYHLPNQSMYRAQGLHYNAASHGSPRFTPFPMHQPTLDARGGSGGSSYNYPSQRGPYPVHEGNPGFQPRGSPNFNNSQTWVSNSPNIGSGNRGRGQGQWRGGGRNQFSGQTSGGGRGRGFHSRGSAPDKELRPESFYDKSIFEDPWQHLEPVLWRGQEGSSNNPHSSSSGSWLPASISKKAKVSEPSKQSLAEYLAQSFNEAASNTPSE